MRLCGRKMGFGGFPLWQSGRYIAKNWGGFIGIVLNTNKIKLFSIGINNNLFGKNLFSSGIIVYCIRNWRYIVGIRRSV